MLRNWLRDEEGQGMVEYGLIIGLIAIVVIGALALLGPKIKEKFDEIKNMDLDSIFANLTDEDLSRLEEEIMSKYYEELMQSLQEAIDDAQGTEKKLKRRVVTIEPIKEYKAEEIKRIRRQTGLSQKLFASYLGVSNKTISNWENEVSYPDLSLIPFIADLFNVTYFSVINFSLSPTI